MVSWQNLAQCPMLGRPQVDTLQGSSLPNLKELRVQIQGDLWRVLFAFAPKRRAIVLVGGNKRGDKRWYKKNIPIAEARYQRHLKRMESATDDKAV
ncbi:MAG: type II toxin-antitoxin system RelE/ParE family toxin [Caldilineaceae bacterium]